MLPKSTGKELENYANCCDNELDGEKPATSRILRSKHQFSEQVGSRIGWGRANEKQKSTGKELENYANCCDIFTPGRKKHR